VILVPSNKGIVSYVLILCQDKSRAQLKINEEQSRELRGNCLGNQVEKARDPRRKEFKTNSTSPRVLISLNSIHRDAAQLELKHLKAISR
jgi:hypothetical protein